MNREELITKIRTEGKVDRKVGAPPVSDVSEMVTVKCLINGFRDNGKTYAPGAVLHMEISVAAAAIETGQVEFVPKDNSGK